jgi:hypothetical protein
MKAMWFLPLTFAGGAEGFALFAPYLIAVLTVLYVVREYRHVSRTIAAIELAPHTGLDVPPNAQPAL